MIKGNVLIVDNDHDFLKTLAQALAAKGFEVIVAGSGQQALKLLEKRRARYDFTHIGIIVSDWNMADGDGIYLLQSVRAKFSNEEIPFVMMSGGAGPEQVNKFISCGADSVIIKPFQVTALVQRLEEADSVRNKKRIAKQTKR